MSYSVWEAIQDELKARGWGLSTLAQSMSYGLNARGIDAEILKSLLALKDPQAPLSEELAVKLGAAFGVDHRFFINLDLLYWSSKKGEE